MENVTQHNNPLDDQLDEQMELLKPYQPDTDFEVAIEQDPKQLVRLLLEAAVIKVETAKMAHDAGQFTQKGFHLGRLTAIIDGLRDRMDHHTGQPYVDQFDHMYQYIDHCVQTAVTEDTTEFLDLTLMMLSELRDAWTLALHDERNDS